MIHSSIIEVPVRHLKAMSGSCHWAQSLNDQKDFWHSPCWQCNGVQGLGAGVLSVRRKRHGKSLPSHEGLSAGRSPSAHVVFPH